ncbi:MAG TPA: 3'-5' exonuclease [Cytophagales bacterium]|nr:3'-5' exonuclease [Cytophagales bacterium]
MVFTKISKEEILQLPLIQYQGEIIVVNSPKDLEQCIDELEKFTLIGFDTEKKPAFNKGEYYPPAWMQLGTENKVYLIRIREKLDPKLVSFLENPLIQKVGVAIRDDIKDLQKLTPFNAEGFIDLGDIARKLGIENYGLRNLAGRILNRRLSKKEQRSNWGKDHLTPEQKMYAAVDAWAGLKIYEQLQVAGYLNTQGTL